jgi:hypothetical protein
VASDTGRIACRARRRTSTTTPASSEITPASLILASNLTLNALMNVLAASSMQPSLTPLTAVSCACTVATI